MAWVCAAALVITTFYVSTYVVHRFVVPLGWDAPGYAWRTALGRAFGVANLPTVMPPPGPINPGRPGFVVVGGLLSAALRVQPLRLAAVLPGVMAAAAGLAAGVAVAALLGRPRWVALGTALGVGTSMFVVRSVNVEGYLDNILALATLTAAITPVALATEDSRALVPCVVLLGATGLLHWNVLEVGLGVIALAALVYAPRSLRVARTGGMRIWATPSARLVAIDVGAVAVAAGGILGALTAPLPSPRVDIGQFVQKVRRDLPAYRLPAVLPAAAAGALALAGTATGDEPSASRARVLLTLLLAWCEVTVLAFVAQWAFGWGIAGHRVLAICLAIPILGTLGVVWAGQWAGRFWRPLAGLVVLASLCASAFLAMAEWSSYRPVMSGAVLDQSASAREFLAEAGVGADRPIVFILDNRSRDAWSRVWLDAQTIRAALPPQRIAHAFVFVGTPEDYLAHRPTAIPSGLEQGAGQVSSSTYNGITAYYFSRIAPLYRRNPAALMLAAANPGFAGWISAHPGATVAPGVALVEGIVAVGRAHAAASPVGPWSAPALAAATLGVLAILSAVGGGWSSVLLGRWLTLPMLAAMAPAVGVAVLALGGVALDWAGLALGGWQGQVVILIVGGAGWGLFARGAFRRSREASGWTP